jgi:vesicle coat complex subunit
MLLDTVDEPGYKAAIAWVIGEYCERIAILAPDVLRKMTKAFCTQEVSVKLQVANLAVKMYLTSPRILSSSPN